MTLALEFDTQLHWVSFLFPETILMLFIKNEKNLSEIKETTYDKEDQMQEYIYENPQILPIEELTGNKKLIVLLRELSTNYGRLDWLGIDEAGNVYIIETKLLRNPDRRNVIAQLLDYGVALWTEYKDPQDLLNYLSEKGVNTKQLILDHFQTSEELADIIIENFKTNLKQGVYQFVAVTDAIEKRILDQIHFINQSSKFSFFLVDLRYYRYENSEFIIPKGYGGEIIKNTSTWTYSKTKQWSIEDFLKDSEEYLWSSAKEFYAKLIHILFNKGFLVEVSIGKQVYLKFFNKNDSAYVISISSREWELRFNKKGNSEDFDRVSFFKSVFDYEIDQTSKKNQFRLLFSDYQNRFDEILKRVREVW